MNTQSTDLLRTLQRGELAATETYQQALEKVGDQPWAASLREIDAEHCDAANSLRQHLHEHGEQPEQGSGAWGTWSKFVEGAAKLMGDKTSLAALRSGEEYGVGVYEQTLKDAVYPSDCCRRLIEEKLLPRTRSHIETLKVLEAN